MTKRSLPGPSGDRSRRTFLRGVAGVTGIALGMGGVSGTASRGQLASGEQQQGISGAATQARRAGTIQQLVDDADRGATVTVPAGVYPERVVVDKPLTLQGTNMPTVDARGLSNGFVIKASDVAIDGFRVRGDDETATGISIVTTEQARSNITLLNNHITGMARASGGTGRQAWGILSWGDHPVSDVTIRNNRIENIGGPSGSDPEGSGITLLRVEGESAGDGGTIERNLISNITNGALNNPFDDGSFSRALIPYGVGLAIQPLDEAGKDGVLVRGNTFQAPVNVVLGNRGNELTSRIESNNFPAGAQAGVVNANTGSAVAAPCNYWGHATGPDAPSDNPNGRGAFVLGAIDFKPWSVRKLGRGENAERSCVGGKDNAGRGRGNLLSWLEGLF